MIPGALFKQQPYEEPAQICHSKERITHHLLKPNKMKIFFIFSNMALVLKDPPADARDLRDTGSIPGSGRSPREGRGIPLQYSCLGNSMDRGAWWEMVHGAAKSGSRLKWLSTRSCLEYGVFSLDLAFSSSLYPIFKGSTFGELHWLVHCSWT